MGSNQSTEIKVPCFRTAYLSHFHILSHSAAIISSSIDMEIHVTMCFCHHVCKKFSTSHTANSALQSAIYDELPTLLGCTHKFRPCVECFPIGQPSFPNNKSDSNKGCVHISKPSTCKNNCTS